MSNPKTTSIEVQGTVVSNLSGKDGDSISLTDMLEAKQQQVSFPERGDCDNNGRRL